jgi:hypothetical protein
MTPADEWRKKAHAAVCTAGCALIIAREESAGEIRMTGLNGRRFEVLSSRGTKPSCVVKSGNVFGGEGEGTR